MPGENWIDKVRQYRLAVDAYCDAVDHLNGTNDLEGEWERTEAAHEEAELARVALLRERPKSIYVPVQSWAQPEVSDLATEEWILGDVGQHGG